MKSIENYSFDQNLKDSEKAAFKSFGVHSKISTPFEAINPHRISIGDYVSINRDMKMAAYTDLTRIIGYVKQHYPGLEQGLREEDYLYTNAEVSIGDLTSFGRCCFITAVNSIRIGKAVIFSDRVYVSDTQHRYDNPDVPVIFQGMTQNGSVEIGDHSWIGIGAVVLNARIGRHCVIGANAVVISDIPDYTVAVGSPARPVKQFNFDTSRWESCSDGSGTEHSLLIARDVSQGC
ncbi:MAG: acyltransferase [Nitrospirota bacterium]